MLQNAEERDTKRLADLAALHTKIKQLKAQSSDKKMWQRQCKYKAKLKMAEAIQLHKQRHMKKQAEEAKEIKKDLQITLDQLKSVSQVRVHWPAFSPLVQAHHVERSSLLPNCSWSSLSLRAYTVSHA